MAKTVKVGQWTPSAHKNDAKAGTDPVDVELCFETFGDPNAPPLLLINGIAMPLVFFTAEFCEALAAAGPYWVIAYDNRDCGLSTKIDGSAADGQTLAKLFSEKKMGIRIDRTYGVPYMITELADDAAGLLEELGVASAHVVGFSSLGGATAQRLLIGHPEKVSSLTLVSAGTADKNMPAPDPEIQKSQMNISGEDPLADGLKAAAAVVSTKFYDEGKASEIMKASIERAAPDKAYMMRQMCCQISDVCRVPELQKASSGLPRAPSCTGPKLVALLTGAEKMPAPSATEKAFTAFVCEVRREGSDEIISTVTERYSAFLDVKDRLSKESIWGDMVAPVPFPPKQVFGRFESSIIKDRVEGITVWLNAVLAMPGVKDCYDLCGFLKVPAAERSPCAVVHGAADKLMQLPHAESCCNALVGAPLIVVEDMGHEMLGIPPALYEPVMGAIKGAADAAGRPAAKK